MDLDKIRDLLNIVSESGVSEVEVEEDDFRLVVRTNAPSIVMQQPPQGGGYGSYVPNMAAAPPPQGQTTPPQRQPPPQAGAAPTPPAQPQQSPPEAGASSTASSSDQAESTGDSEAGAGENEELVRAPIVGTFYRRPSPDDDPFVREGDTVSQGDVLCIIEAMKIMNEIECETSGTVTKVLAEDEEPVEFDQPLFVVETS